MQTDFLKGKTILITGGTGSFGKHFVEHLLNNSECKKIIVFSRDEYKQSLMRAEYRDERLRFFLGDVRDLPRLQMAFKGVDFVVHAAALKQVPTLEYNPFEAVKTNVLGSQNVIDAAIERGVQKVLLVSTDKAAMPINLYGSTKLCAEKLFVSGNSYTGGAVKFACVRYGNVIGSRGSIVEKLLNEPDAETVHITDEKMTRFWLPLEESFKLVLFALSNMEGGEIFVPKVPSMKLVDLFDALAPNAKKKIIGIRPGEKLHETLLIKEETKHAVELDKYFVILPEYNDGYVGAFKNEIMEKYLKKGRILPEGYCYGSDTNDEWLDTQGLKNLIAKKKNTAYTAEELFWQSNFGREYTERNQYQTPQAVDELYNKFYGVTWSEMVDDFLKDLPINKTLEVGCNSGNQLNALQFLGFGNLYGIDIQPYAVEKSKEYTKNLNIIQGSAFDIPFKENNFDLVFTDGVLIHINPKDIKKIMREIYRVSGKYILGLEYFEKDYIGIDYRGEKDKLWKGNFSRMYMDLFPNLRLRKEKFYRYTDNPNNVDVMFLLEKM